MIISLPTLYNLDALKRAFMLWSPPIGDSYVWLYGANNIKYMVLPQERTMITPLPNFTYCRMSTKEPVLKRNMGEL